MSLNPVRAGLVLRPEDYRWLWSPEVTLLIAGRNPRAGTRVVPFLFNKSYNPVPASADQVL